ncbi:coat protein [Lake Sarah-associated circular virus-30]|uniref:coat protein n=1 Tax=Lake Sarah-associated circular virus-30 TaxID=1685758 RepID=UPI0007773D0B|nr:coat protein [Lake Sarah-associated circular virus-30]ALE29705.1 coat protein [Lake Sarah-associated circular virus-30]
MPAVNGRMTRDTWGDHFRRYYGAASTMYYLHNRLPLSEAQQRKAANWHRGKKTSSSQKKMSNGKRGRSMSRGRSAKRRPVTPRRTARRVSLPATPTARSRSVSRGRRSARSHSVRRMPSLSRSRSAVSQPSASGSTGPSHYGSSARGAGNLVVGTASSMLKKYAKYGVVGEDQWTKTIASTAAPIYYVVGHCAPPNTPLLRYIAAATVKAFFLQFGFGFDNFTRPLSDYGFTANTDIIEAQYVTTPSGAATSFNIYTYVVGNTVGDVVDAFFVAFAGSSKNLRWDFLKFKSVANPSSVHVTMYLQNAKIHLNSTSFLKLQNRTVESSADIETDDVDIMPLIGRQFDINGTILSLSNDGYQYACDESFAKGGLCTKDNGSAIKAIPYNAQVRGKSTSKNITVAPGEILTSKIKFEKTIYFSKLQSYFDNINGTGDISERTWGKSRFFFFERPIKSLGDGLAFNFKAELDVCHEVMVVGGNPPITTSTYTIVAA